MSQLITKIAKGAAIPEPKGLRAGSSGQKSHTILLPGDYTAARILERSRRRLTKKPTDYRNILKRLPNWYGSTELNLWIKNFQLAFGIYSGHLM